MPAPSSIVPIDIACSFRIDRCTCVLAPAGPDTLPGQARVPAPSGSCNSPGAAPDYLPGRAGSAADLSPASPISAARRSPRPGEFCRPTPPRARGRQKDTRAAGHHLANHRCAGRKADHGTGLGKGNHSTAEADPDVCASELLPYTLFSSPRQGRAARARRSTPLATRRIDPPRPRWTRSRQARTCS
jgi:hypothetical protein